MDKKLKNLLVFGYGLCVILGFFSWKTYRTHGWTFSHFIFFALIAFFLYITNFHRDLLEIIYNRWMKVAGVIGYIVNTLLLSVIFYVVFGIVGIILRILRKDLLSLKLDRKAKSYWIKRDDKKIDMSGYTKQF